jgi:hypothetical protein
MGFVGEVTIEATIAFLGSLAYLLASARSVSGLLINLLRYHPQVIHYHNFVDASDTSSNTSQSAEKTFPTRLELNTTDPNSKDNFHLTRINPGELSLVLHREKVSTLNLASILPPLFGQQITNTNLLNNTYFVSDAFRFASTTVMEQLCAQNCTRKRKEKAIQYCRDMGADTCFEGLPNGYDTSLNEVIWNKLSAQARVAIRVIPLFLQKTPNVILIDIGVVRGMGDKILPILNNALPNSYLFLVQNYASNFPGYSADHFLEITSDLQLMSGDKQWFQNQLETATNINQESSEIPNAELLV